MEVARPLTSKTSRAATAAPRAHKQKKKTAADRADVQRNPPAVPDVRQQATGLILPIYGQDLFSQPDAYRADATSPAPVDHLIGPAMSLMSRSGEA